MVNKAVYQLWPKCNKHDFGFSFYDHRFDDASTNVKVELSEVDEDYLITIVGGQLRKLFLYIRGLVLVNIPKQLNREINIVIIDGTATAISGIT